MFTRLPLVVKNLLLINIVLFFAPWLLSSFVDLHQILGLHHWSSELFRPHQLVTYMFMHAKMSQGGFEHIFFNMFALFMFGRHLEVFWGPKKFLIYYMITGIGAGILHMTVMTFELNQIQEAVEAAIEAGGDPRSYGNLLNQARNVNMVGASGSVFGLLLAFGMIFPNIELIMLFFPVPIKAKYFVMIYGVMEVIYGIQQNPSDNVAHFAHLGGMLFGFLLIQYWKKHPN